MLTVGSLFSGAGLCDLGLTWAGFKHLFFCECDPYCRAVLARHWPGIPIIEDVKTLTNALVPQVDVLCGGFPCQDVSLGGKREGIKDGTRSGMWSEYARIIAEMRPRYAIIENVPGLLSKGLEIVLGDLAGCGYDAEWDIVPAAAAGAPHLRERLFIVAYPDSGRAHQVRTLATLPRNLGNDQQSEILHDWLGIRFDRKTKSSALSAYPGSIFYRVDDGAAQNLDPDTRPVAGARKTFWTSRAQAKAWVPIIRALANGILPHQAYAVGACILEAEGLPVGRQPRG